MKPFLIAVLVLTSTQAFATKARYKALNSSFHLVDTQSEFTSPYHVFAQKDFVSIESGNTAATSVDDGAEAIVKFSLNDSSKLLIAIGHKDAEIQAQRKFINTVAGLTGANAFVTQQNPIEVIYAMKTDAITWGVGAFYSQMKDKAADNSESSSGLRLAASHGDFKWKLNLGLENKVSNATSGSIANQPYGNLGLRYGPGNNKFGLDYTTWKAKRSDATAEKTELQSFEYENIKFQYVYTNPKDGDDIFYGIAIDSISLKDKSSVVAPAVSGGKLSRLALPVWIGVETQANEWLTLRGSIKQTLCAQSKDEKGLPAGTLDGASGTAGTSSEFASEPNNTEVAMGLGLKFNQLTFDGLLAGLVGKTQNQSINQTSFLAQAGMTYAF